MNIFARRVELIIGAVIGLLQILHRRRRTSLWIIQLIHNGKSETKSHSSSEKVAGIPIHPEISSLQASIYSFELRLNLCRSFIFIRRRVLEAQ